MSNMTPPTGKGHRSLAEGSEAMLAATLKRRVRPVQLVEGITWPADYQTMMVTPENYHRLNLDDRYQREPQEGMINDIIAVLRSGGRTYQPIMLCERENEPNRWYVADGQQRMWAHMAVGLAMPAILCTSTGWIAERSLYNQLNHYAAQTANSRVKTHDGRGAEQLRHLGGIEGQPYYNQIDFGQPGFHSCGAMIMVRAMGAAASGSRGTGGFKQLMPRLDAALENDPLAPKRVDLLIRLIPDCFPVDGGKYRLLVLPATGLGRVIYRRLRAGQTGPPAGFCSLIRRVNWPEFIQSSSVKFLPVVEERIERHWPE